MDLPGVTASRVTGFGRVVGRPDESDPRYMCKLECLVPDALCDAIVDLLADRAHTGRPGDGKIAIIAVQEIIRIRTGERGVAAL
jgi:nitrogen regulatory protein P-II 1